MRLVNAKKEQEKIMNNEFNFEKFLLCEQHFGSISKKDVISTISGYLTTFKKNVMQVIRDRLEHVQRINDYKEVGDVIDNEINRMNAEYIQKITEFLNTRKFN
jgi:hypothetical protein